MKKALIALIAGLMIFGFCACGSNDDAEATDSEPVASEGEITTDTDEPRYTSDGELIVEEELPASDGEISE